MRQRVSHRGYFASRKALLAQLIGVEAARSVARANRFLLIACAPFVAAAVLDALWYPVPWGPRVAVLLGLLGGFVASAVAVGVLIQRSASQASEFLSNKLGRRVRLPTGKLSVRWWQTRVERETGADA